MGAERSAAAGVARSAENQRWMSFSWIEATGRPAKKGRIWFSQVAPVGLERTRFPDPLVAPKSRLRDGLEQGIFGELRRTCASKYCGPEAHCVSPLLADGHVVDNVQGLPESATAMLKMKEISLFPGRIDPYAKALQLFVADAVNGLSWAECPHAGVSQIGSWHRSLSLPSCTRGTCFGRRASCKISQLEPQVWCMVYSLLNNPVSNPPALSALGVWN